MERAEAWSLLRKHLKNKNLRKHALAVEAVMRGLARRFQEDGELWGLAGLLHDIDYEATADEPDKHGQIGAEILRRAGLPETLCQAVLSHNPRAGREPQTLLEKALYAVDPVTGLIVAAALIHPERRLAPLDTEFILNRFKEKSFARGASRAQIETCSRLGLTLPDFIALSLESMQEIAPDLGL